MTWEPFGASDQGWDEVVEALGGSVFQSAGWAAAKAPGGWTPVRALAAGPDGRPRAAIQALRKTKGPAALLWARGGPTGDPALWDDAMRRALAAAARRPAVYLRVSPYAEASSEKDASLRRMGWGRPDRPLDRGASFSLDLTPGAASIEAGLSSNWAHNLRRARSRCAPARLWPNPDPSAVLAAYRAMEAYKGISLLHDDDALSAQLRELAPRIVLARVDGPEGNPLALRAAALCGGTAWDLMAATTPEGRRCYASYAAFWAVLTQAAARGAAAFELGGADPARAKGVFDFKRGTGARPVQYLGELDWAFPSALRRVAGLAATRMASGGAR